MRNRVLIVILLGTSVISVAAMATVYEIIPVWALVVISVSNAIAIAAVMRRGASERGGTKPIERTSLIWPLALLLGAGLSIFDASRTGWKTGDVVGAAVCLAVLLVYFLVFRKRRNRGSSL